jgi:hypothetical protein
MTVVHGRPSFNARESKTGVLAAGHPGDLLEGLRLENEGLLMTRMRRAILGFLASLPALGVVGMPGSALGDTKSCVASHSSAQREAKAGRLRLASQLYTACGSDESCPERLRTECAELLDKVRAELPTVIFSVLDENGKDVSNVQVFSTDELITEGLDGRAIAMDPGKHRIRFLLPWGDVLSSDVLIREGEKSRLVQVKIEKAAQPEPVPAVPAAAPASPPPAVAPVKAGPPLMAWVMSGVAVAGAGTFATFALLGKSQRTKLDDCAPACGPERKDDFDAAKRSYLIGDIGLGVAVASAAVAAGLFLAPRGDVKAGANPPGTRLAIALTGQGGALLVSRSLE